MSWFNPTKTLVILIASATLLTGSVAHSGGSVKIKENEKIEWTEKRSSSYFHVDKDPNKSGWRKSIDTIYHTTGGDNGKEKK